MNKVYHTDRLILKVLKTHQAQEVLDYYLRNKDFLHNWEPERGRRFYTYEYQQELLKEEYHEIKDKSKLRLWIYKKEDEERTIGSICFSNIIYGNFLSCFLGYKLDKEEINKGYTTEAVKKGVSIMFEEYKLHRVEANIIPENTASIKVVEKAGFEKEGYSKRYLNINGKWKDHIHFAIYNDELNMSNN
ncbi:MAG: GNAT family N-acetyltransferase [Tissierellales bacterium]|nr:GNAT family N-acetyltransferase [Tissierellales bacterium]HCX03811.1 30S ribosomal protein S5 alanine N-acetyltransferase [Clostridiales bacterium]